jgi:hypothetical protein
MMDFKIYIPSYKRAGGVSTVKYITESLIVIPESQYREYRKHYAKNKLIVIDDSGDGTVSRKRNSILDLCDQDRLVMMDDDLKKIFWIDSRESIAENEFYDLLAEGFDICGKYGAGLFGFNWDAQPIHLDGKPITFNKIFFNTFGIVKSEIRFDENLLRADDVDFWAQHTIRDRKTVRFNFIKTEYEIKGKNQKGGIDFKVETKKENLYLQKKYPPGMIRLDENYQMRITRSPYKDLL